MAVFANCAFASTSNAFPNSLSFDDAEALNMIQLRASVARVGHTGDDTASGATAVFVAGLEGCGHGFLLALFEKLGSAGYIQDCPMPKHWNCYSMCEWNKGGGEKDMVTTFQGLQEGPVYILKSESYPYGTGFNNEVPTESDPNYHEDRRDRFHPHMDWISEAASKTSVDFRVLFLYRPMEEALAASCVHRKFEATCTLSAETLVKNAEYLVSQINDVLTRGYFVQCMMYGDVPQMIGSIEGALGTDAELSKIINDVWRPETGRTQVFPADWSQAVDIMRAADKELHKLCKASPRISDSSNFLEMLHYSGPVL